jgi:hypothetical protein
MKWDKFRDPSDFYTTIMRCPVQGGWLVRVLTSSNESMAFLPDPDHTWDPNEEYGVDAAQARVLPEDEPQPEHAESAAAPIPLEETPAPPKEPVMAAAEPAVRLYVPPAKASVPALTPPRPSLGPTEDEPSDWSDLRSAARKATESTE